MPSIITASELRSVLGVSSALYSDAYLNDIIDTSEAVILPLLTTFASPIAKVSLTSNVATFETVGIHEFTEGQSVVIAGCGSPFNGTQTINDDVDAYTFTANITNADIAERNVIPSGSATLTGAATYVGVAAVEVGGYGGTIDIRVLHDTIRGVNFVVHYFHGHSGGGAVSRGVIHDQRLLAGTEGYDLTWMSDGQELWRYIKKYKPYILSSPSRSQTSRVGKDAWLKMHLQNSYKKAYFYPRHQKQLFSGPNKILIDD